MRTQKGRKEMRVFWVFIPDKIGRPHQPKNERIREKTRTLLLFFRLSADVIDPTRTKEATDSCLQLVHFFSSSLSLSLKTFPFRFVIYEKYLTTVLSTWETKNLHGTSVTRRSTCSLVLCGFSTVFFLAYVCERRGFSTCSCFTDWVENI